MALKWTAGMSSDCVPLAGDLVVEQLVWAKPVRGGRAAVRSIAVERRITTDKIRDVIHAYGH